MAVPKVRIKVVERKEEGYTFNTHLIEWREGGKRFRKKIKDPTEAASFVATKQVELANGVALYTATTKLTPAQVTDAELAVQRLGDGHTINDAVSFYLEHFATPDDPRELKEAVRAFIEGKEKEGLRERSLTQLESTLKQFREHAESTGFELVHTIKATIIESFLQSLRARNGVDKASLKTWNNYRADLSSFFSWCADPRRRWIAKNPVESVHKFKKLGTGVIETLSIKEALRVMRHAEKIRNGELVPFFALALFAGIRTGPQGELFKLAAHPELIDRKRGIVNIPESVSKTSQKRQVVIRDNLAAWLDRYGTEILPTNFDRGFRAVRKSVGGLGHDVLRHSFITYHVSAFRSVGDAAIEAGNSEGIVKKHYLNLATKKEGLAFWRIAPKKERA